MANENRSESENSSPNSASGQSVMTPRQRLRATLNHQEPDRLCVDFGAGFQTGMGAGAVYRLSEALLGRSERPVKVSEPYQMLGEIDEQLREALHLDVVGVHGPGTMFGFRNDEPFKPFKMMDGTPITVPEGFQVTTTDDGGWLIYPEGDTTAPPRGRMPAGGYFFDAIVEQSPVDDRLNPADNCEEFGPLSKQDAQFIVNQARRYSEKTDYGIYLTIPGCAFGDIALVPATWMKRPRGIRDVEEWYISTITRPDYIRAIFDRQLEFALQIVDDLAAALGDMVDVAFVSGTDFGAQHGLFISADSYRSLFKPYHVAINKRIHELTNWKTFIHSCGAVADLIAEFIDAGFDVLNPVQCSACGMDAKTLKQEFGSDIVFWGGGIDTQRTLPFGTPDEVYRESRERIDIFAPGGGFVFNSIHNVQSNVPTPNLLAMFRAINDARGL